MRRAEVLKARAHRRLGLAICLALASGLLPEVEAGAQPSGTSAANRVAARALAQEGLKLLREGRPAPALEKLSQAYALFPAPTISLLQARALTELGRWVEAVERYRATETHDRQPGESAAFTGARDTAKREREVLEPRIPRLTIEVDAAVGDQFEVLLDGKALPAAAIGVPWPVDAGRHQLQLKVGGQTSSRPLRMTEGTSKTVVLDGTPALEEDTHDEQPPGDVEVSAGDDRSDSSTAGPLRPYVWVAGGVGVVGISAGVIFGLQMNSKQSDLDAVCKPECPPSARSDLNDFRSARTLSFVGWSVGLVGLGTAAVLWLLDEPAETPTTGGWVRPTFGPTGVQLHGAF